MPDQSPPAVLEIARFRLRAGAEPAAFLRAAEGTGALLRRCPGFVRRMLTEDQGQWADLVEWQDRAAALAAADAVMPSPEFAPFLAMIEPASVSMDHHDIRARMA
ncbi:MAG: hypothetical protein ACT4N9_13185 [Paracoccaceae bacterium]